MARMKLKLNQAGFRALRNSPEIKADIRRRAERIADAAGEGFVAGEVREGSRGRNPRAHNVVITNSFVGRRRQSKDNVLQRAINAGR